MEKRVGEWRAEKKVKRKVECRVEFGEWRLQCRADGVESGERRVESIMPCVMCLLYANYASHISILAREQQHKGILTSQKRPCEGKRTPRKTMYSLFVARLGWTS